MSQYPTAISCYVHERIADQYSEEPPETTAQRQERDYNREESQTCQAEHSQEQSLRMLGKDTSNISGCETS